MLSFEAIAKCEEALQLEPKSEACFNDLVEMNQTAGSAKVVISQSAVVAGTSSSISSAYLKKAVALCEAKLEEDPENALALTLLEAATSLSYGTVDIKRAEECLANAKSKFEAALRLDATTTVWKKLFSFFFYEYSVYRWGCTTS
jgi:tetratricopeptide (TPR) repeat protein